MKKKLETLLRNYLNSKFFKGKTLKIKKNTKGKKSTPELKTLFEDVGRDFFKVKVRLEIGRCPYCETVTQLVSVRPGYYTCTYCKELTKQHINGSIQYLPVGKLTL